MLGKGEVDLHAALHALRIDLRQIGVDAQGLNRLQVKELLASPGIDQLARIDGARGDHAVEGRIDLLEGLQLVKALHVGLRGADSRGCSCSGLVHEGIGVLLRNGVGLDQARVAVGLDACVVGGGLRRRQVALRLRELLIQLRSGDLGQQRALLHLGADVEVPVRQIA